MSNDWEIIYMKRSGDFHTIAETLFNLYVIHGAGEEMVQ